MAFEDECEAGVSVVGVGLGCIGGIGGTVLKRSAELFGRAGIERATFEGGAYGLSAGILKYETSGSYLYITVRYL